MLVFFEGNRFWLKRLLLHDDHQPVQEFFQADLAAGGAAAAEFSGPVKDSTDLAINVEPAGTSPQAPTTPVLAAVTL